MLEEAKQTIKQVMFAKNVSKPHSPSNFHKALAEPVGTYIFIFWGCGSGLVDRITSFLMDLMSALGHVSGAHFNPAVTLAFSAARRLPLLQNKVLSGVAIGVAMLFNVIIAGHITGASMNPGRSVGPAIVSGVYRNL
ncbi:hypothetical protein ACH5RR_034584 [Cinchona calisaya]|uniref:Uncharacterized protein n=1 Tax=Cinchona calisaya TaxID=153742 RepID=A0ABD2YCK2_9GENT